MIKLAILVICVALICGILGTIIVHKDYLMITGGIAHTSFGGVGLAIWLGFNTTLGAGIFAVLAALYIIYAKRKYGDKINISISLLWAAGMALGISFYSMAKNPTVTIEESLFGDITQINNEKMLLLVVTTIVVLTLIILFYESLLVFLLDETFAEVQGANIKIIENVLMVVISICIVSLIHITGIILVMALLTAPAATAASFKFGLKKQILLATGLALISSTVGISLYYALGVSPGGLIALVSVAIFVVVKLIVNKGKESIN
ncbi:MAG: metal ABC transporter permease [Peptostreptococcaceae bacterium]|nr:metal ABC transporter permease [Peptostreptococcaceae bacterium]